MSARLLVASLALTALAGAAACQSSGRYGGPGYAGAAVGAGVAGAVASRAAGGCVAQCLPGTHCNTATGLCERSGHARLPPAAGHPAGGSGKHPPMVSTRDPYPADHEYEVPSASLEDAGCVPTAIGDGGAVACEMDGGTI